MTDPIPGIKLGALPSATAWAAGDQLLMRDISADEGVRSQKTTFAKFFGNVPAPIILKPTDGFTLEGVGDGGDGKSFFRAEFPDGQHSFHIGLSTFAQGEGERNLSSFRIGAGFKDQEQLALEDGINGGALLAYEMDYVQGGYKDEIWFGMYCRDGVDDQVDVRPIFISAINDDPETYLSTVVVAVSGQFTIADPSDTAVESGGAQIFTLNRVLGRYRARLKAGQSFDFIGDETVNTANLSTGSISIQPHGSSNSRMALWYSGATGDIFNITNAAGGNIPNRLQLGLSSGGPFFSMRKRADNGSPFGFGVMPLSTDPSAALFFAEGGDFNFGTTTGTKFGTTTSQKWATHGATPVVQVAALTAVDTGTINSGDATTDGVIANLKTRIGELEAGLVAKGIFAAAA